MSNHLNSPSRSLFRNLVIKIFRPFLLPIHRYFLNQVSSEISTQINTHEVFTHSRFEQIKEVIFEIANKQHQIVQHLGLSNLDSTKQAPDTYVSNGLIDANSYIEKALIGENMSLKMLKEKYGDDGAYFLFEKLFRGSEQEISRRQSFYMEYIRTCYKKIAPQFPSAKFADIGFGRGEFLSLLRKEEISSTGADTSLLNYELATSKGFSVAHTDALTFLKNTKDSSLGGITMFQIVEHISYEPLKKIISLSYQKIVPGGIILIETVNPSCDAAMRFFYIDPTHVRPYPPETLRFVSEWEGFTDMKIIYYMPVNKYSPATDTSSYVGYALIGYKPININ